MSSSLYEIALGSRRIFSCSPQSKDLLYKKNEIYGKIFIESVKKIDQFCVTPKNKLALNLCYNRINKFSS